MRRITKGTGWALAAWVALALALAPAAAANLLSREYAFKPGTILDVGLVNEQGLRIDNVRFDVPSKIGGKMLRVGRAFTAEVALSNTAEQAMKAGVAIALHDAEGRLLGVASGGSKIASIKPGRQKSFTLVFDGVNQFADQSATFQISIESE